MSNVKKKRKMIELKICFQVLQTFFFCEKVLKLKKFKKKIKIKSSNFNLLQTFKIILKV